jgi:hypothetical protein
VVCVEGWGVVVRAVSAEMGSGQGSAVARVLCAHGGAGGHGRASDTHIVYMFNSCNILFRECQCHMQAASESA